MARDLFRAQERFIAAILRGPGSVAAARTAGLIRQHIRSELRPAFDFALGGDRDQIRRAVQNGECDVPRLYRLGVEMGYAQVVHLGRQIRESVERERSLPAPTRDADHPLAFASPAWSEPGNAVSAEESSGAGRRTAVLEFLRQILARGPVAAREVERLAVAAGLLAEGTSIGDSKAFGHELKAGASDVLE